MQSLARLQLRSLYSSRRTHNAYAKRKHAQQCAQEATCEDARALAQALGFRMNQMQKHWLMFEVVLCFALPAYFLFWGLLFLPVLLVGAARGFGYVIVHVLCTVGGALGMVALVLTLRYIRDRRDHLPWLFVVSGMAFGLASILTTITGQFRSFSPSWFAAITLVPPTLCSLHILWLAVQKYRIERPNKLLHATREDALA